MTRENLVLLETPLITIEARADVVWAVVENRQDVDASTGAECARRMAETLLHTVLVRASGYRAVICDVRRGPVVFGPNTRAQMERIFRAADQQRMPIAVVVSGTTQRMQFDSMAGIYAGSVSRVSTDPREALEFATSFRR